MSQKASPSDDQLRFKAQPLDLYGIMRVVQDSFPGFGGGGNSKEATEKPKSVEVTTTTEAPKPQTPLFVQVLHGPKSRERFLKEAQAKAVGTDTSGKVPIINEELLMR